MMIRSVLKPLAFAALAAALSLVSLLVAFNANAALRVEMDRELPRYLGQGFHPPERAADQTFAWTTGRASLRLDGLDRRRPWTCELRFRGARPDPATLPDVMIDVDGVTVATRKTTNDFEEVEIEIPARTDRPGATLSMVPSNTFRPGPGDARELGIQVDRLACAPAGGLVLPPTHVMLSAAGSGAVFGVLAGLFTVPIAGATAVLAALAMGLSVLLSSGPAPYGTYSSTAFATAFWIAAGSIALLAALRAVRREPLSPAAVLVVLISAVALDLKVLGLLHPSKLLIDALFHAHRLEWVLSGRYFFTQGMPGGVSFPYAIGLYVFASPWSWFTSDHVALLRVVVTTVEVTAGGLLYVLIVKAWRDAVAGVTAVVLYHCVPITFEILGNANMTNVFGQAVALMAVVTCALWPSPRSRAWFRVLAFAVTALAFLSHISTFSQLVVTLVALGSLYWWVGAEPLPSAGRKILAVAAAAAVAAAVLYYGHFLDVYRTAWRARTQAAVSQPAQQASSDAAQSTPQRRTGVPLHERGSNALRLSARSIGWPILVLALFGSARLWVSGLRQRLPLVVAALFVTYVVFLAASTASRVDAPFERYAAEFVGRVVLATFSAAVILAAVGAAWGLRAGLVARIASGILLAWALSVGAHNWMAWFR